MKKHLLFYIVIAFQFTFFGSNGQMHKMPPSLKDTSALSKFTDSLYAVNAFSGIIAIAKDTHFIYKHMNGLADKEEKIPISENTIFNMGSITKVFTSIGIIQLKEQGKLKLSDPVSKYLPEYPDKKWAAVATIENLLTHTSGLADFFPTEHQFVNPFNLDEIVDTIGKVVVAALPSEQMIYSNAGFYLLGRIIEKVSGLSYFDYVQKNIFDVAGMHNTYFENNYSDKRFAKGYYLNERTGKFEGNDKMVSKVGGPAGGAMTCIRDLLSLQVSLKNHKLLQEPTFKEMTQIKVTGQRGMGYGLGIGVGKLPNGMSWIGHNGGAPGVAANFVWFPANNYTVIVLINQDSGSNMPLLMMSQMLTSEMK